MTDTHEPRQAAKAYDCTAAHACVDPEPRKVDTSDPGKAALVAFAAAWLFCRTSEMNAENAQRIAVGASTAYGDSAFSVVQIEAVKMADTGEVPEWVSYEK